MKKVVSIHSFRGGTGKSNITANLASLVAMAGNRVGVIDTDIHSPGIHVIFRLEQSAVRSALNDYLWGRCPIEDAAYDVTGSLELGAREGPEAEADRPRVFLIPSSIKPGEIAQVLREGYDVGLLHDGFRDLARALQLDYLFIDTHPGVNEETLLSIAVSDLLLLVLRPDNQDFQGSAVTVELARRLDVKDLQVVINKVPQGTDWGALRDQVETAYGAPVVGMMPLNAEIAQMASSGIFVVRHPAHPFTQGLKQVADRLMS
jgi:MinD-like ATPase involved in chromosome partitioning or flagellar assembly